MAVLLRLFRSLAPPTALVLAAGCEKDPVVEVIPGVHGSVAIALLNPTECPACDPFAGIDALRLDVSVGDAVVASNTFLYPDEDVTLPDLADYGVARFTLVGLAGGRVTAAGRTPEVVIRPDVDTTVPMAFLPVNRALPLVGRMQAERYGARAFARRGGDVVVVGGLDPTRRRALADVEVYAPANGAFTALEDAPVAAAGFEVTPLPDGEWLFSGGYAIAMGDEVPLSDAMVYADDTAVFRAVGSMTAGRDRHCLAMYRERQGLVLGGADAEAEYLKPGTDSGEWTFTPLTMRDLEVRDVTGCVSPGEDSVYVQGRDAASTGVWSQEASEDPSEAFRAVSEGTAGAYRYVSGARLLAHDDGSVRILGGADVETGEVYADGRLYAPAARRFSTIGGFQSPRYAPDLVPWIEDGWYAAGCGWADAERTTGEDTVELLAPFEDVTGALIALDRERQGCALAALPDGALLVVGGGPEGVPTGADAALIVPWLDAAAGG